MMFKSVSNFVFVKSTEKSLWLLAVWQLPMPSSVEFFRDASGARRTSLTNPLVLKLPRSFLSLYIARFTFVSFSINHLALFVNSALEEGVHDSVCHCHPLPSVDCFLRSNELPHVWFGCKRCLVQCILEPHSQIFHVKVIPLIPQTIHRSAYFVS